MVYDVKAYLEHPHVLKRFKDGLAILNYDHAAVYGSLWDEYTRSARGLILDERSGECVARPWSKFFNLNEVEETRYENLPDLPFTAQEKLDGYLGVHFRWMGAHRIATRGSFDSEMAQWGQRWFGENVRADAMDSGYTYLFEIIYSRKIVISYDFEGLVLLGAVEIETGREMPHDRLSSEAAWMGVRVAPLLPDFGSLEALAEHIRALPGNREGCVVTFSNGLKVKIKGEEYCRIHKMVSRMTPLAFWEAYDPALGAIPQRYLEGIPEEFRGDSDRIKAAVEGRIESGVARAAGMAAEVQSAVGAGAEMREFAIEARRRFPKEFGDAISYRRGNLRGLRKALHRRTRPTGNVMEDEDEGHDRRRQGGVDEADGRRGGQELPASPQDRFADSVDAAEATGHRPLDGPRLLGARAGEPREHTRRDDREREGLTPC